jgi:hypothetical protein
VSTVREEAATNATTLRIPGRAHGALSQTALDLRVSRGLTAAEGCAGQR